MRFFYRISDHKSYRKFEIPIFLSTDGDEFEEVFGLSIIEWKGNCSDYSLKKKSFVIVVYEVMFIGFSLWLVDFIGKILWVFIQTCLFAVVWFVIYENYKEKYEKHKLWGNKRVFYCFRPWKTTWGMNEGQEADGTWQTHIDW